MLPDDPAYKGPFLMGGSGVLVGDTIEFTLTGSQKHMVSGWRDRAVMHLIVDKTTLNGTFYAIRRDFNTNTQEWSQNFTSGTFTLTGPTIPLATPNLAPLQLLLE